MVFAVMRGDSSVSEFPDVPDRRESSNGQILGLVHPVVDLCFVRTPECLSGIRRFPDLLFMGVS